jgi:hypothetical protein
MKEYAVDLSVVFFAVDIPEADMKRKRLLELIEREGYIIKK